MQNLQYLNQTDVAKLFNVKVNTIRRWRKEGKIPPPIFLTYKTLVWEKSELQKYISTRSLSSDQ
jgi:predicted DNA-binding transcriptional regulator AlpA